MICAFLGMLNSNLVSNLTYIYLIYIDDCIPIQEKVEIDLTDFAHFLHAGTA